MWCNNSAKTGAHIQSLVINQTAPSCCILYFHQQSGSRDCIVPTHMHILLIAGCGQLSLENGMVTYTNRYIVGSVATHTCDTGYRVEGDATWTCTESGWDGQNITCGKHTQPECMQLVQGCGSIMNFTSINIAYELS